MHKNENRPGYKKTKVGWIPEGWDGVLLGQVLSLTSGKPRPQDTSCDTSHTPVFGGNGIMGYSASSNNDGANLIIGRVGEKCGCVHRHSGKCWITDNALFVTEYKKKTDIPFLYYSLSHLQLNRFKKKAGQPLVSQQLIYDLGAALPPLPEQEAIAEVLECWDKGLRTLENKIVKKRRIKKGLMQKLLSGKTRLPGFSKDWKNVKFGEVTVPRKERIDSRRNGIQKFCVELEHIEPETGKLLGNTSAGETASLKTVFQEGDILFGKLRAYLRKYWLADQAGVCSTEIWVFAPKKAQVTAQYLFQLIKTDLFIDAASSTTGTHMPRTDWNAVKNYEFTLPPLEEQRAIAEVLAAADREIEALERKLALWKDQKKFLLNNLVTGTIRLPEFKH